MRACVLYWSLALVLGWSLEASAKIYKWVDKNGGVHYTEDLSQVPPEQRLLVEQQAGEESKKRDPVQKIEEPAATRRSATKGNSSTAASGGTHRIRVQGAASAMYATTRINNSVDVVMHVDTGASYVVIGRPTARALGIQIDSSTPTIPLSTANGIVVQPMVMLDSVQVGTARIENVQAIVSDSFGDSGLLGLTFFNHFNYTVDSAQGIITLTENKLGEKGVLKGGRTKEQWGEEFRFRQAQLDYIEENMHSGDPSWQYAKRKLERELEELNSQADQAGVPDSWRY